MPQTPELTSSIIDNNNKYKFTLKNIAVSTANALRRTILSDIPVYVFRTETEDVNLCKITENTSRFHNEIIKQRLSCVPINYPVEKEYISGIVRGESKEQLNKFLKLCNYELILNVENNEDYKIKWVTTEDFRLRDKSSSDTNIFLAQEEVHKIFPKNNFQCYIDFIRLRPRIGKTIPGEKIMLNAGITVCTARDNGMYNVVSICTFENKRDESKVDEAWLAYSSKLDDNLSEEDKQFEKSNFMCLQGERCFVSNKQGEPIEFQFTIQSIGMYESPHIVQIACDILMGKFMKLAEKIEDDTLIVISSDKIRENGYFRSVTESTIPNSYDIVLEHEDYTIGCVLENILYDEYYLNEKLMTYVGFKKYHPHDDYSIIRIAYKDEEQLLSRSYHIKRAITIAISLFKDIKNKIV